MAVTDVSRKRDEKEASEGSPLEDKTKESGGGSHPAVVTREAEL